MVEEEKQHEILQHDVQAMQKVSSFMKTFARSTACGQVMWIMSAYARRVVPPVSNVLLNALKMGCLSEAQCVQKVHILHQLTNPTHQLHTPEPHRQPE